MAYKDKEKYKAYQKAYREANKDKLMILNKAYRDANVEKIKASVKRYNDATKEKRNAWYKDNLEKIKKQRMGWRKANPEIIKARRKAYREANKEALAERAKIKKLKIRYGITFKDREELLIKQEFKCLYCLNTLSLDHAVIDHNHMTGVVRGLLHKGCNVKLGVIEQEIIKGKIPYLEIYINSNPLNQTIKN